VTAAPEKPKLGRKPLAAGSGKTARLALRTTPARKAMIEAEAKMVGISENAWIERAVDALAKIKPARTP
jgi:predicted HicB family RNase H-like nuclease